MRIFLTKVFARFAESEDIAISALRDAVMRAETGLIDADLGGGVIKQRIARRGGGKSGGYRTIILFRREALAIFVYGYTKSARDNIGPEELKGYRKAAGWMLRQTEAEIEAAIAHKLLQEIIDA